jgi:hypothetical protein
VSLTLKGALMIDGNGKELLDLVVVGGSLQENLQPLLENVEMVYKGGQQVR